MLTAAGSQGSKTANAELARVRRDLAYAVCAERQAENEEMRLRRNRYAMAPGFVLHQQANQRRLRTESERLRLTRVYLERLFGSFMAGQQYLTRLSEMFARYPSAKLLETQLEQWEASLPL